METRSFPPLVSRSLRVKAVSSNSEETVADPPSALGMGGKRQLAQTRAGLDRLHLRAQCQKVRRVAAAVGADFQDGLPGFEDTAEQRRYSFRGCFVSCCGRAPGAR